MSINQVLAILVVVVGNSLAFFLVFRALIIGLSLKKGKVPYVPVDRIMMVEAITALNLKPGDRFVDIGSGDGKVVLYTAKRNPNIQCVGVEINRWLVYWSRIIAFLSGRRNAKFIHGDALDVDLYNLSSFNRVFLYLTLDLVELLNPLFIKSLKKGSKIFSCKFGFGKADFKSESVGVNGSKMAEI